MANDTISNLRARVEALGYKLVTADFTATDRPRTGLYVLDPNQNELEIVDTGDRESAEREVEEWCERMEREDAAAKRAAPANEWLITDFNCPPLAEKYERFLSLLVMAGLKDRLRAMDWLRRVNVEEAIAQLENCTLTAEHLPSAQLSDESVKKAAGSVNSALRLIDLCAAAADNEKSDAGYSIRMTLGNEVYTALHEALVAIGAEVVDDVGCYQSAENAAPAAT